MLEKKGKEMHSIEEERNKGRHRIEELETKLADINIGMEAVETAKKNLQAFIDQKSRLIDKLEE